MSDSKNHAPIDPDAVLEELLDHCRSAAEECFRAGRDGKGFDSDRAALRLTGVKVIKTSLEVIAAMKSGDVFEKRKHRKTKTIGPANGAGVGTDTAEQHVEN